MSATVLVWVPLKADPENRLGCRQLIWEMVTGSTKNMCLIDPVTLWATELGASGGPLKNRAECTSEMSSQCWTLEHLPTLVHHRLRVFSGTVTASSHPNCVSGLPWKKQPWEKLWEKS